MPSEYFSIDQKSFEKSTIKLYLDYCYGIYGCVENLSVATILELMRFLAEGFFSNKQNVFTSFTLCSALLKNLKDDKITIYKRVGDFENQLYSSLFRELLTRSFDQAVKLYICKIMSDHKAWDNTCVKEFNKGWWLFIRNKL